MDDRDSVEGKNTPFEGGGRERAGVEGKDERGTVESRS